MYKDLREGKDYDMIFAGGLVCCSQNRDGTLEPRIGWAVLDK